MVCLSASASTVGSGGDSSRVDMVDDDESMSDCAMVYLLFLMSSVKGARKETFFDASKVGRDGAKDVFMLLVLGNGPLLNIDVILYATLYGTSIDRESTVDIDVAEEDVAELVRLGMSISEGVGIFAIAEGTSVAKGVSEGRCDFPPGVFNDCAGL